VDHDERGGAGLPPSAGQLFVEALAELLVRERAAPHRVQRRGDAQHQLRVTHHHVFAGLEGLRGLGRLAADEHLGARCASQGHAVIQPEQGEVLGEHALAGGHDVGAGGAAHPQHAAGLQLDHTQTFGGADDHEGGQLFGRLCTLRSTHRRRL
jgi:hypothetical protein